MRHSSSQGSIPNTTHLKVFFWCHCFYPEPQHTNHQCEQYSICCGGHHLPLIRGISLHGGTSSTTGALAPGASQTPLLLTPLHSWIHYASLQLPLPELSTTVRYTPAQLPPLEYSTLVVPQQYLTIPLVLHHKWRQSTILTATETVNSSILNFGTFRQQI